MAYIVDESGLTTRKYRIVTEVPHGYQVWNIGRHNFRYERMVPLCICGYMGDPNWIFPDLLCAIEMPSEELAMKIIKETQRKPVNKTRFNQIVRNYGKRVLQ